MLEFVLHATRSVCLVCKCQKSLPYKRRITSVYLPIWFKICSNDPGLGPIHTGRGMRCTCKLEHFSFDVACLQCGHPHLHQQVPFACVASCVDWAVKCTATFELLSGTKRCVFSGGGGNYRTLQRVTPLLSWFGLGFLSS